MNTTRTPSRRVEENDVHEENPFQVEQVEKVHKCAQVPPHDDQVVEARNDFPVVPPELSNRDIREVLLDFSRAVTIQENLTMEPRVNVVERTMTSILRDLLRMNPPIFLCSKEGVDPPEFLNGVYKVLSLMEVTSREKEDLALYQLRDVPQVWNTHWENI